ncbi:TPA: class I SAM-dependent methyltransferase [Candidatus Woesearchaeota archaeon]|nr:class I SAM-dependent methyltransferase [Candidatus Woesearchaeota archaeon]HIH31272.1 class I SAM-dependent methyltransferase [Candidatus Woesearchaeota archaeon]HIH54458.1 class I SAM-dependent methyltransferase [Candidatus Woesearchaeota archaeon]HIJ01750.1 class I SAM-dependent methyltransferase [Candidatus Woesearchaeota archaeon]HIJ13513.1 class I SAM-dependent methyltransferase [Candidatus Woesearchaeota archaeon]
MFFGKTNMKKIQYDGLAKKFVEANATYPENSRRVLHRFLDDLGLEGKRVLETGSGPGVDLEYMISKGAIVYGVDHSKDMNMQASEIAKTANIYTGSINILSFDDNYFDIVYSRYTVQHLWNITKTFSESHRVLKKSGVFLLGVTHPMRQYFEKDIKDYWKKEWVESRIIGEQLVVREPSHTFEEYLSEKILNNFTLEKVKEIHEPTAEQIKKYGRYAQFLIIQYRKK